MLCISCVWLFYPGLVTPDSIVQFEQASLGSYTNVHPPLMAAVWRLLLNVGRGASPMLAMNMILYWGSFVALSVYCVRATKRRSSVLAVFAGLWPLLLSFSGVIWKDVVLAAAWGLSSALMLVASQAQSKDWRFWSTWAAAALLMLFGSAMRHNAFPAAIVLSVALAQLLPANRSLQLAALSILASLATFSIPLSSRLLEARDGHPIELLISWDITGIRYFRTLDGGDKTAALRTGLSCYSPRLSDNCPVLAFQSSAAAISQWEKTIAADPMPYLQHRALVFSMLMRFGCNSCRPAIFVTPMDRVPSDLRDRHNPVRWILGGIVSRIGRTPLGRPYVWLTAAIGLAVMFSRTRRRPDWPTLTLISASGLVYALTYFPAAVTDEFRYIYWLIFSVVVAGTAYLFAWRGSWRDLMPWVILPVLVMVALDTAVQQIRSTDTIAPSMATNY